MIRSAHCRTDRIVSVTQPGQRPQLSWPNSNGPLPESAGLRSKGRNLYEETESSGTATLGTPGENGLGTIAQGFLESSNVSVVEEVVQMVTGQRAYEANSKVITTADQLLQTAINLKR